LLARPSIIVLDDSTAAIDAVTERHLHRALKSALADAATIIIAHKLSSLCQADEILLLEAGRVVERGTHADLLSRGGRYAALWDLQNGSPAEISLETVA
ncbi:MAG: metal ABC transporter permease, partial [Niveispirillum sp.]